MDQSTILALVVAGAVAPWLTEVIKIAFGDLSGKKALTLAMVVSFAISGGVLVYENKLVWNDPKELFVSAGLVLGIASTVYQFLQKAVESPANALRGMLSK